MVQITGKFDSGRENVFKIFFYHVFTIHLMTLPADRASNVVRVSWPEALQGFNTHTLVFS
ncbi:hypothetical protein TDB9533_03186 [Thalassocella blandensis]|nr:hypothetical protein TDB9533_03186 [Thalassocella blandensis]